VLGVDEGEQLFFVAPQRRDGQRVDEALGAGEDDHDLALDRDGRVLALLEQLGQAGAAVELLARGRVEVAGELGEVGHRAELRELELERAGDAAHGLDLGAAADAADRDADVDGGPDARVEEVALEEDLPVGDRDDVRRDVRRHVVRLRLDDRQRGQRAARIRVFDDLVVALGGLLFELALERLDLVLALRVLLGGLFRGLVLREELGVDEAVDALGREVPPLFARVHLAVGAAVRAVARGHLGALLHGVVDLGHLRRPLEQARVDEEHVARVRLAPRRPAQEQRELPVGHGLLRQVVVDAERVAAGVAEVLGHRDARVGRDELQRRRLARGRRDDGRVLHRAVLRELVDDLGDRALLLPDGDVEAVNALALLVDDGVDRDRGLARLPVADDELALAAADRHHRVDRLDARLQRLFHRLAVDDAGRLDLDAPLVRRLDRALAVDGPAERVDHAADERLAHGHLHDAPGALDRVALFDGRRVAEERDADVVGLEVEHQPDQVAGELDQLAGHRALEAVNARDAVADVQHGARLGDLRRLVEVLDVLLDDLTDFFGAKLHGPLPFSLVAACPP
jgi:hypothetical protein